MTNDAEFLKEVRERAEEAGTHVPSWVAFKILDGDIPRLLAMIEERDKKLRVAVEALERYADVWVNPAHQTGERAKRVLAKIRGSNE